MCYGPGEPMDAPRASLGGSFQDRGALRVCDRSHHFTDGQHPGPQAGGQQNSGTAPCGVFKPTQEPVTITAVSAQS